MATGTLHTEISLADTKHGAFTRGYLTISSTETVQIDEIQGHIILEKGHVVLEKGYANPEKMVRARNREILLSFIVITHKLLIKNEVYKTPFSFELNNSIVNSTEGIELQIAYKCQLNIGIKKEDEQKLNSSLFTKKRFSWNAKRYIKVFKYFKVEREENAVGNYQIVETVTNFTFRAGCLTFLIVIIIFFFLIYI